MTPLSLYRIGYGKIDDPKKFSMQVETIVQECGCSHMEAVLDYCEKNNIEQDTIIPLITKSLKEKIECNERELNFLPKVAQLPI